MIGTIRKLDAVLTVMSMEQDQSGLEVNTVPELLSSGLGGGSKVAYGRTTSLGFISFLDDRPPCPSGKASFGVS